MLLPLYLESECSSPLLLALHFCARCSSSQFSLSTSAMRRLLVVLISCYSHFLFVVRSSGSGDGLLCAHSACANLKEVSFPFGAAPPCGASPTFLLSDCNSMGAQQAYWWNFNGSCPDGFGTLGAPAVMGIDYHDSQGGLVNLTWHLHGSLNVCHPAPYSDISHYLPNSINLAAFANSAFQISDDSIYLLFHCSNSSGSLSDINSTVEAESPECYSYQAECGQQDIIHNCFRFKPDKELMLRQVMERLECSHFMFFVSTLGESPSNLHSDAGMVQLTWTESNLPSHTACAKCEETKGTCGYNVDHPDQFECFCPGRNQQSDTEYCPHVCNGRLCSPGSKIALGVPVSVVAIFAVLALLYCCLRRRRKFPTTSVPDSSSSNKLWSNRALGLSGKFGPATTKEFSYAELLEATESFADRNMIGDGGFGAVYKGFLRNGHKVAIKRLYHDNFRRMEQFYNEMKILSSLQHPNLVKLYGFCCQDDRDLLLVFEYASKGTVSDQLHDVNKPAMPWKVRLNIAWETAEALSYLHNSVSPPIFHRDVKTTNILLDEDFHVKLADFGLSRLVPLAVTHVSTAPQGTPGYVDPDYHQCYQLTDKSDVYSFGVVLMELVSAQLAVDMSRNRREINLSSLALMKIACGAWQELVDPRLEMDRNQDVERMVKGVVELVFQCLQAEKDDRPSMSLVAETLANLRRESGYEYEEVINAQHPIRVDINAPSPEDEKSQMMKPKFTFSTAYSPNSVDSWVWTSSNTSSSDVSSRF